MAPPKWSKPHAAETIEAFGDLKHKQQHIILLKISFELLVDQLKHLALCLSLPTKTQHSLLTPSKKHEVTQQSTMMENKDSDVDQHSLLLRV